MNLTKVSIGNHLSPLVVTNYINDLLRLLNDNLVTRGAAPNTQPHFRDFRADDVCCSPVHVGKVALLMGYKTTGRLAVGVIQAMPWYVAQTSPK